MNALGQRSAPDRSGSAPGFGRDALLAAGGGLLMAAAFPPVAFWPVAFVCVVPLLHCVRRSTAPRAFLLGTIHGAVAFGALLYWVLRFGEAAWILLILLSASFVGAFALLAYVTSKASSAALRVVGAAGAWTLVEYVRGSWPLGGFTWGGLGVSQADSITLPLASVGGVWAVSFVVALVNASIAEVLVRGGQRRTKVFVIAAAGAAAFAPALIPLEAMAGQPFDVASIQVDVRRYAGLPPEEEDRAIAREHASRHLTLRGNAPNLVVWGEGALDPDAWADPTIRELVRGAVADVGAPTLVGAVTADDQGERTSALLLDARGSEVSRYDKVHLVPFGEYVPWRERLTWFEALDQIPIDRVPGAAVQPLRGAQLPSLGVAICFENAFPAMTRELVRQGAELLVVPVNNASYGSSAASAQHLQMSRIRAVETGRWLVNAGISGITASIDPTGSVIARTELFDSTVLLTEVRTSNRRTIYVVIGDAVVWLGALGVIGAIVSARRSRRRPPVRVGGNAVRPGLVQARTASSDPTLPGP